MKFQTSETKWGLLIFKTEQHAGYQDTDSQSCTYTRMYNKSATLFNVHAVGIQPYWWTLIKKQII